MRSRWSRSVTSTGSRAHPCLWGGEAKSKRYVLRRLLKVATEVAERTDSGRLFQREGAHALKALAPVLVLILGTDRVIPLLDLSESDKREVAIKERRWTGCSSWRALYISKQILKWNLYFTGSQWRERSSGTLRVNSGDFVTTPARRFKIRWSLVVSFCNPRQKWITVIKTARH